MPARHDIEVIPSSRSVVFRCKQCRADFRTVDLILNLVKVADGKAVVVGLDALAKRVGK